MSFVPIDRTAFKQGGGYVRTTYGKKLYVLERGAHPRTISETDVGTTETAVQVYEDSAGTIPVSQPLFSDENGRFPYWIDDDPVDLYMPEDTDDPLIAWNPVAESNSELGYAEITANFSTTSSSYVDVPGLSVPVDSAEANGRPMLIRAWAYSFRNSTSATTIFVSLLEGSTARNGSTYGQAATDKALPMVINHRAPAPVADATWKIQIAATSAGTAVLAAATVAPSGLEVLKV